MEPDLFLCANLADREFHRFPIIPPHAARQGQTHESLRHSDAAYSPYAIQRTARPPTKAALLLYKTQSVTLMTEPHPGAMLWLHLEASRAQPVVQKEEKAMAQTPEQAVSTGCFFEEKRNETNEEKRNETN